ncbi:hypothetical protein [Halococcus agarilyticus]|uniref:hypothetical protein n=1 Tax=Halococcus agarilyticus TaxID=1232219 RepID=UPI0018967DEC|nr:hypothetical protein [Halococcus agarilyticus]
MNSTEKLTGFTRPGRYTYSIYRRGFGEGRMGWSVTRTSDTEVAVGFHYELGAEVIQETLTGTPENVTDELLHTSAEPFLRTAFYPSITPFSEEGDLTVGDRLALPSERGEASVEITGTVVHGDMECFSSTWRFDDVTRYRDYVSPETGLVFSAISYPSEGGEPLLTITLVEDRSTIESSD